MFLALFLLAAQPTTTFDCRGLLHAKVSAHELVTILGKANAARLAPDYHSRSRDELKLLGEVGGDQIYASDLPAMRKLNPRIHILMLDYEK